MKDTRPVNLDITTFKFPLPAITSILHRVSGVALFIATAILLYLLQLSLSSEQGFSEAVAIMDGTLMKIVLWAITTGLFYHLIAGVKHLLMDLGWGETKQGAHLSAQITLGLAVLAAALAGAWIW
ncbi:MAG: succinate dehydrogenase, cytochrome b556 subunit [Pseudomonadales bacterium]|nr:succinate dehydrogenase, cytochrome b556 subunit [Pseudomonadales bacterium]MBL6817425.1 succinate dehydrogenase, cytochrome b556 subunit [Pseudomonadales bacterium]MCH1599938.1 succinate dehydrogenase, cytochrome b556 subunit [Pseudomonadales bacterium]